MAGHNWQAIRRTLSTVLSLLLGLTVSVSCAAEDDPECMSIVKDGEPRASIVISGEASSVVVDAAKDLQRCIEKMSGAKLAIEKSVPASVSGIRPTRITFP